MLDIAASPRLSVSALIFVYPESNPANPFLSLCLYVSTTYVSNFLVSLMRMPAYPVFYYLF